MFLLDQSDDFVEVFSTTIYCCQHSPMVVLADGYIESPSNKCKQSTQDHKNKNKNLSTYNGWILTGHWFPKLISHPCLILGTGWECEPSFNPQLRFLESKQVSVGNTNLFLKPKSTERNELLN
uniref:Uncharacterized protein n=1 Tax=Strigamia maritima TaxID=126957 RepID=T1JI70_STRMM